MQILVAPIEEVVLGEKTYLSADEAAGQTSLSVENSQGFASADYLVVDIIGSEIAELLKISSTSTNSITLASAITIAHAKGTQLQVIRYNQRKFYRSSTEDGTYSHLSSEGSPVNIQVDQPEGTEFEDSSGTSSSWYKSTYYNSTTGTESSLDDAVATKAGDTEHYTSIYKIKVEAGFQNNSYIGSDLVDRFRTEAEAQADGAVVGVYQLPFSSSPKLFQHIVTLLAAGNLLAKEYGLEADVEISKTGQRKIERAEELLEKIRDGKIILIGEDGSELLKRTDVMASSSNTYDENVEDRGELFNLNDEHFKFTDPTEPLSDSRRTKLKDTGFV
ncbi:MAG: phage protein Gp36 family protein [Methanogenium sp.]|jgi:hypothetical protein